MLPCCWMANAAGCIRKLWAMSLWRIPSMGVRLRFSRALASKRLMYKRQTDSDQPSISFNQFDIFVCIYIYINIYICIWYIYISIHFEPQALDSDLCLNFFVWSEASKTFDQLRSPGHVFGLGAWMVSLWQTASFRSLFNMWVWYDLNWFDLRCAGLKSSEVRKEAAQQLVENAFPIESQASLTADGMYKNCQTIFILTMYIAHTGAHTTKEVQIQWLHQTTAWKALNKLQWFLFVCCGSLVPHRPIDVLVCTPDQDASQAIKYANVCRL